MSIMKRIIIDMVGCVVCDKQKFLPDWAKQNGDNVNQAMLHTLYNIAQ